MAAPGSRFAWGRLGWGKPRDPVGVQDVPAEPPAPQTLPSSESPSSESPSSESAPEFTAQDFAEDMDAPLPSAGGAMLSSEQRITLLVNEQLGFVERVLRNLGVPDSDLDDAVQRTFILAAKKLPEIREGSERGFLFKAAKHMAAHVWRSRARFRGHEVLDEQLPSAEDSPEHLISQKRARELLDHVLDAMPEDLRVVFTLYEFEELSVPEIAEMLEIPTGTAASRLRRARSEFSAHIHRIEARNRYEQAKKAIS